MQLAGRLIEALAFSMWKLAAICAFAALFLFPLIIHEPLVLLPVVAGIACCIGLRYIPAARNVIGRFFAHGSSRNWVLALMIAAVVVRIPVMIWPSPLYSDMSFYHRAAVMLAHGVSGAWGKNGLGVFYPPGESLFLAPWIALLGDHPWEITVSNTFLTVAAIPFLYKAFETASAGAARSSAAMLALYPSLVLWSGTAGHETAEIFVLSVLLFLYTRIVAALTLRSVLVLCAVFGLALGAGSLIRPTFPALLALTAVAAVMKAPSWKRVSFGMVVAGLCMALAIAPWTIRNYREYGRFCLISANGGFSLLGVVHPLSDGVRDYNPPDLGKGLDLIERDHLSMDLALHYVTSDPIRIARLAVTKVIREWGSDTSSSIDAVVGVPPRGGDSLKHALQAVLAYSWAWLVCAWVLGAMAVKRKTPAAPVELWCVLWVLMIFGLYLLFSPQARYHYPVLPFAAGVFGPGLLSWMRISTEERGDKAALDQAQAVASRWAVAGV